MKCSKIHPLNFVQTFGFVTQYNHKIILLILTKARFTASWWSIERFHVICFIARRGFNVSWRTLAMNNRSKWRSSWWNVTADRLRTFWWTLHDMLEDFVSLLARVRLWHLAGWLKSDHAWRALRTNWWAEWSQMSFRTIVHVRCWAEFRTLTHDVRS